LLAYAVDRKDRTEVDGCAVRSILKKIAQSALAAIRVCSRYRTQQPAENARKISFRRRFEAAEAGAFPHLLREI